MLVLDFDLQESIAELGFELTLWRMGMQDRGYATITYVDECSAHISEWGESFNHEWDTPVTLHYAETP